MCNPAVVLMQPQHTHITYAKCTGEWFFTQQRTSVTEAALGVMEQVQQDVVLRCLVQTVARRHHRAVLNFQSPVPADFFVVCNMGWYMFTVNVEEADRVVVATQSSHGGCQQLFESTTAIVFRPTAICCVQAWAHPSV